MKIIFAQGNPGTKYERTRHNTGFIVLDRLASSFGARWRTETKFRAEIADIELEGEKILLVKPASFYNETGPVARTLLDFYKLDPSSDFMVIHDELALPFGTIRVREKGSDAGNNGIKSLNAHLGPNFWRIRIGIWNEQRNMMDDATFVLSAFSNDESTQLEALIDGSVSHLISAFLDGTIEAVSHSLK